MRTTYLSMCDHQQSILRGDVSPRSYAPYGTSLSISGPRLAYCGQHHEPQTGGYVLGNGHRHYSPGLLRFTTPDTLSPFETGGINPYAYCNGDPINFVDRSGQERKPTVRISYTGGNGVFHPNESFVDNGASKQSREQARTAQKGVASRLYVATEVGMSAKNISYARKMQKSGDATRQEIGAGYFAGLINALSATWETTKVLSGTDLYDVSGAVKPLDFPSIPLVVFDLTLKTLSFGSSFYAARKRVEYNNRTQATTSPDLEMGANLPLASHRTRADSN